MIIAIDASRANKDNKTGTEWYSYYIIQELKKIIPPSERVILYTNKKLKGDLGVMPSGWREKVLNWPPRYLWTQIRMWWELLVNPPDILFVPAHTIPFLPIKKKIRVAVTVHDVGFKRFPKLYKKIQYWYHDLTMRKIRRRADQIITISNFSRREIIDLYRVKPEKIFVTYLGYDQNKFKPRSVNQEILNQYQISQPYLLYVGRLEKKKNVGNLIKAFASVKAQHPDLELVLAGGGGNYFVQVKAIIDQFKLTKEIVLTGYLPEKDLPEIFSAATVFLFPTLYEGFGLPIIQAQASGVPVITANFDPQKEVAGGAAILVDPRQPAEIAQAIDQLLTDQNFKNEIIKKGLSRAQDFSWTKTAGEVWTVLSN